MAFVPDVNPAEYETRLQEKVDTVKTLFRDFPKVPDLEVFRSPPEHYRSRCEFTLWHDDEELNYVMYEKVPGEAKPQRKIIEQYAVACKAINEMMPVLLRELKRSELLRRKVFQANFHCTSAGNAMVTLLYHKKLQTMEADWKKAAAPLRAALQECPSVDHVHIIGRSKNTKLLLDEDFVIERQSIDGREFTQKQPEGTFSQPNGTMCVNMVTWADRVVRGSQGDCLELYCGNGNFTIPMARNFRQVVATELSKASVAAAHDNLAANDVTNVFMVRMSSEEFVEAWRTKAAKNRLKGLDMEALDLRTLVVDPPRAGLDADTVQLMSEFECVVYVSCNPETLHENLQHVKDSHEVRAFALFDQFPFTPHIECGVYLVRKPPKDPA